MKTKILIFALLFSVLCNAQNEICIKNEEQLSKFIQDKDYVSATELIPSIIKDCPKYSDKTYQLASEVLLYNVESSSEDKIEEKAREFIKFLDTYDKNFPNNTNGNFQKRALVLYNSKVGTNQEILNFLDKAYTQQRATFTDSQMLYTYLKLYYESSKENKSVITKDDLIEKYIAVIGLANENAVKLPEKSSEYGRVIDSSNSLLSSVLVCENLVPYAKKGFENNKKDVIWLDVIAMKLSEKCKTDPVFETVGLELHKINPSAKSANYLGTFYMHTKKESQSIDYFTQSVTLSKDDAERAKSAYYVASILSNSYKAKAKEMILTSIKSEPSNGKYYIFLANLYANSVSQCGTTDSEKKAIYQLASNTVLKAGTTEARLKSTADKMSKDYLKNVVIDKTIKNKSVKINCWINETVQF